MESNYRERIKNLKKKILKSGINSISNDDLSYCRIYADYFKDIVFVKRK